MSLPTQTYNVSGNYVTTVANGTGDFTVNAGNIIFNGNVTQQANAVTIADFITVAANNTGVITDMGLLGQTGNASFAGLRFDVTVNAWQISSSVYANGSPIVPYANIGTGTSNVTVAGSNTQIQFNEAGAFGASANLKFDYANNSLILSGYEVLGNIGTTPSTPTNAVAMYNSTVGAGGTGVYVLSTSVNDELISKTKAIIYSLIF
jgi:hypothetical protein